LRPSQEKAEGAQCHKPKREKALFVGFVCFALTKNRQGGFSSQNDVKFPFTQAAKVSVKPFQRLAGCGAEPHIVSLINQNFL